MVRPEFGVQHTACHPLKSQSFHPNHINLCLGDGSVRAVSRNVSDPGWAMAETPKSGDLPSLDD
jgi:hypothetical protein